MQKSKVRREDGLIDGVEYVFDSEGLIDWRKMIKPEFLVPNKQYFERFNKPIPTSIEGLEDKELLILLGGIKCLARLRGYSRLHYVVTAPTPDFVAVTCHIAWIPNFETEDRIVETGGTGDACAANTNGLGKMYLTAIAENRAFVRCVRNFLGVQILGQDEIGPKVQDEIDAPPTASPQAMLIKLMDEKKVSFDEIKTKLVKEQVQGAEGFTSVNDLPRITLLDVISRIKNKKN